MDILERLKPICSTDPDRPTIATPFRIAFEGIRWAAATNGHALVALPFDGELRTDGPDTGPILGVEPPTTHAARLAVLREWAGNPYPKDEPCPSCKGTPPRAPYVGLAERGRYCEPCDSLGRIVERHREGRLLAGGLNRILLARVLCTVPDDTVVIRLGQRGTLNPYILRADRWIAAVMPINGVNAEAPRLEVTPLPTEKVG